MKLLTTFVLVGTIDSVDALFATVEISTNPPQEQMSLSVIPVNTFPCEIKEGDNFYILKLTADADSVIICNKKEK